MVVVQFQDDMHRDTAWSAVDLGQVLQDMPSAVPDAALVCCPGWLLYHELDQAEVGHQTAYAPPHVSQGLML